MSHNRIGLGEFHAALVTRINLLPRVAIHMDTARLVGRVTLATQFALKCLRITAMRNVHVRIKATFGFVFCPTHLAHVYFGRLVWLAIPSVHVFNMNF